MTTITVEAGYVATDLSLARIGLESAIETASSLQCLRQSNDSNCNDSNFPVGNIIKRNTYETMRPTQGDPKIIIAWSVPTTVNYLAIARHNLADLPKPDGELYVTPTGGSSELVASFSVTDNAPLLVPFAPTEIEAAEIHFGNLANGFKLAVCHLGLATVMERPLRASIDPLWLSGESDVQTQMSDGGEVLGAVLVRRGVTANPSWNHLSRAFYNGTLRTLARDMVAKPFFLAWRPDEHPEEVIYGGVTGDPSGSHISGVPRYTFRFSMKGIGRQ